VIRRPGIAAVNGAPPVAPGATTTPAVMTIKRPSRPRMSRALLLLAAYTFIAISRVAEIVPSIRLALLVAGLATVCAFLLPRQPRVSLFRIPEGRAMLALLTLAVLSIPISVWPGQSLNHVLGGFSKTALFFFLILYVVRTVVDVERMVWAILFAILYLQVGIMAFNVSERAMITETYDPNDIAFVMACALPLAVSTALANRRAARWLAWGAVLLAVLVIVWTRSRGGFVSMLAVCALITWRLPTRTWLPKMGLAVAGLAAVIAFAPASYWERMGTIWGEAPRNANDYDAGGLTEARWNTWMTGVGIMLQNPLLGVGAGAYETAEGMTHGGVGKWEAAHNSFIQIGAELGLVGLGLFLYLIWRGIRNCQTVRRMGRGDRTWGRYRWLAFGLEISLYAYVIAGSALSQAYSNVVYAVIALTVVLRAIAAEAMSNGAGPLVERPVTPSHRRR
jgi:O-antigen ligase